MAGRNLPTWPQQRRVFRSGLPGRLRPGRCKAGRCVGGAALPGGAVVRLASRWLAAWGAAVLCLPGALWQGKQEEDPPFSL